MIPSTVIPVRIAKFQVVCRQWPQRQDALARQGAGGGANRPVLWLAAWKLETPRRPFVEPVPLLQQL